VSTHLVVRVGELRAALPARDVRQVTRAPAIAPLPGGRGALCGLLEFGGEPLAVLDLARLLGAPPIAGPAAVAVVVRLPGADAGEIAATVETVALGVDEALDVVELGDDPVHGGLPVRLVDLSRLGGAA
jgi:chemotaxis signal transduction protein